MTALVSSWSSTDTKAEVEMAQQRSLRFIIAAASLKVSFPSLVKGVESSVPGSTSASAPQASSGASATSRWPVSVKAVKWSRRRQEWWEVVNWTHCTWHSSGHYAHNILILTVTCSVHNFCKEMRAWSSIGRDLPKVTWVSGREHRSWFSTGFHLWIQFPRLYTMTVLVKCKGSFLSWY